jgi:hypothetical protein
VLLLLLALIAFLGTLAAARDGVLAARTRYFDAVLVWQPIVGQLAVPLPGARLLLLALFIALVLDRRAWRPGPQRRAVPLVHAGVVALLATGLWSAAARKEGVATLEVDRTVREVDAGGTPWRLPIALRLRGTRRDYYPGTDRMARFEAEVEVDAPSRVPHLARIALNAPLHREGVTVYLRGDPPGMLPAAAPVAIVIVRDPAGAPRLVACGLLVLGLLAHFAGALRRWVRAGRR